MRPIRTLLITAIAVLALAPVASAAQIKVAGGVLTYTDTDPAAKNNVTIAASSATTFTATERGTTTASQRIAVTSDGSCTIGRATSTSRTATCPAAGVTAIQVRLGEQDDSASLSTAVNAPGQLFGEGGNDTLRGGSAGDLLVGGPGADALAGGLGHDTADYSDRTAPVTVSADSKPGDGEAGENDNVSTDVEVIAGGAGGDTLVGNAADNELIGNAGDDVLAGGGGANALRGGDGFDRADYSSAGAVSVTLNDKADDGPAGAPTDFADVEGVIGSPYSDVLIGNAATNSFVGGEGDDRILPGGGADTVDGGAGDDIIQTLDGVADTVVCGDGEDGVVSDRKDKRTDCDYIKYRVLAASNTRIHLSKGAARIPVRCSPATTAGCTGRVSLTWKGHVIGTRTIKVASGRRFVAALKINKRNQRALKRAGTVKTSLVVRARDQTALLTKTTQTIRLAA
jgi:Ca2+-binding RTX toxin-like protein